MHSIFILSSHLGNTRLVYQTSIAPIPQKRLILTKSWTLYYVISSICSLQITIISKNMSITLHTIKCIAVPSDINDLV